MVHKRPTCFVAMPITTTALAADLYGNDQDHFIHVLEHLFNPAIDRSGYQPIRPKMLGGDLIQATIIRYLQEADLLLCDITMHNPNVFFELGIRTALNRPVALVKDDKTKMLPSIMNMYEYESGLSPWTLESQISGIAEHIRATADRAQGRNAMWQYFGLTSPLLG
jgi:hypothetical protein